MGSCASDTQPSERRHTERGARTKNRLPRRVVRDANVRVTTEAPEHEFEVLEYLAHPAGSVHQRDLARIVGLSLGMTNAIIKRLAQKGWLTIRKVNNRNIRYAVSATGIEEITRRSYRYVKRTIKNIVVYRRAIEELIAKAHAGGYRTLVLVGHSDLDFIVEHACHEFGLGYVHEETPSEAAWKASRESFVLYSENKAEGELLQREEPGSASLLRIMRRTDTDENASSDEMRAGKLR